MDPLLAQKTQELYMKITQAKARNIQLTPDDLDAWMRRETNGKFGLSDAQGYVQSLSTVTGENLAGSFGQGMTFNFLDEARGAAKGPQAEAEMRLRDKAFSGKHPFVSGGLKAAGALLSPAVLAAIGPEALVGGAATGGALLTRAAVAGGAGAGLAAAGASEAPDLGGRLEDAAGPAAFGVALGPAAVLGSKAVGALGKGAYNAMTENADATAVRLAGRMMPPGLEQQAARHEMLAPGTFIPAAADETAAEVGAGVGASPPAALNSMSTIREAWRGIREAKRGLKADYNAIGKKHGPIKIDDELRDILHSVGEDSYGPTVHFDRLQRLRTQYRIKAERATNPNDQQLWGDFKDRLTEWLTPRVKGLSELDSRYSFLSQSEENIERAYDKVANSNKSHGRTNLFGGDPTLTTGGSFPTGVRGMATRAAHALTIDKAGRADAVARQLLQPADAAQVARLAQARAAAMAPRPPAPGTNFVAPLGGSDAIMTFFKMLQQPLPDQLRLQDGAQ
jgi:hypothetical protein